MLIKSVNPVRRKFDGKHVAFGSFVFSTDAASTEILAAAGFDLAVVDTEHAGLTIEHVYAHGRATRACGISWWVRVGKVEQAEIGRYLDAGAQGIIFPHFGIDCAGSSWSGMLRYPPGGTRPTCTGISAANYGTGSFPDYVERSNNDVMAVGLIEDRSVVENIDAVLDGCGLDAVMPGGVGDLASSYGLHGNGNDPVILEAVERVILAARNAGIAAGVYLSDLQARERYEALKPDFYLYSIDYKVLANAYSAVLKQIHD